jgi:hypothetical protein
MSVPIFANGIQGLSDGKWSGTAGSCDKLVGIDYRTIPGTFQAHQALAKSSGEVVDELCENVVDCSDGSILWFSSESGKIWRDVSGTYTLAHTTVPTSGEAKCLGAMEYNGDVYWATESFLHKIAITDLGDFDDAEENYATFAFGDDKFHPMVVQNLNLYIGDDLTVAKVEKEQLNPEPFRTMTRTFDSSVKFIGNGGYITPSASAYPRLVYSKRQTLASGTTMSFSVDVPDKSDMVMAVYLSSYNATTSPFSGDVTATLGVQNLSSLGSSTANFGGSTRAGINLYRLVSPTAGTETLTFDFDSITETNLVATVMVFSGANTFSSEAFDTETTGGTLFSVSDIGTDGVKYQLPVSYVLSETATHTFGQKQISVFNANNTWGTDSTSYFGTEPVFTDKTEFNLVSPERIQTMIGFDVDILVGTRNRDIGRVLRWDGISEGWSAQDDIDEQGINAFIRDDNFVYVQAGYYGRMYFYNGEKLEPYKRLYGDWSPTKRAEIKPNSVAFHLGTPVFGFSNTEGNPVLQGVYGFGSYGTGYTKSLSLDYPLPTDEFSGVTIGAILTIGADLYVAYKTGTDVGVAKLNWSSKYNGAYLETTALVGPKDRSEFTTINGFNADYTDLPANTDIDIAIKKSYEASYTTLLKEDMTKLKQIKARTTIIDIANLQVKISLTTSSNTTPNIENVSLDI